MEEQDKRIEELTAQQKQQAAQIQKVCDQLDACLGRRRPEDNWELLFSTAAPPNFTSSGWPPPPKKRKVSTRMNRWSSSMPGMNGRREIIWSHVRNGVMRICRRPAIRSKTATVSYPDDSKVLKVPKINSLDTSSPRPFWSVMIPVYNPRLPYLEETLRCVLDQDAARSRCKSR